MEKRKNGKQNNREKCEQITRKRLVWNRSKDPDAHFPSSAEQSPLLSPLKGEDKKKVKERKIVHR